MLEGYPQNIAYTVVKVLLLTMALGSPISEEALHVRSYWTIELDLCNGEQLGS